MFCSPMTRVEWSLKTSCHLIIPKFLEINGVDGTSLPFLAMRSFHWVSKSLPMVVILHHRHHHRTTGGCIVLEEKGCNQESPLGLGDQLIWWSWDVRYRSWMLPCVEGWYNIVGVLDRSSWPKKLRSHGLDHVLIKFCDVVIIVESFGVHQST